MSFEIKYRVMKKYTEEDGVTEVVIPDSVTEIGKEAFYKCESLTEVTIPDSVTKIGEDAFYGCKSLTEVTIPDSVTEIGIRAFDGCSSLKEVTIPDSVTEIGGWAFIGTKWLKEYPEDLVIVGNGILINYKGNDENVVIPDSVTKIGEYAFYYCSSLTEVTIPDSVTEIGEYAFRGCESLTEVTIPDSVTVIGELAFSGCKSLTKVTIPDSVTEIGDSAFEDCESLTEVTIPDSVTTIGDGAFNNCERFTPVIKGIKFKADGEKFSKDFNKAIKIPETKDFSAKLYTPLKTAVIVEYYLESGDADAEAFIKKGIKRIMTFLIDGDNVGPILKLLETGKFVTDKNILTFIDYANSLQKMEIQLIFMNYSHEHFKPKKPKLKL